MAILYFTRSSSFQPSLFTLIRRNEPGKPDEVIITQVLPIRGMRRSRWCLSIPIALMENIVAQCLANRTRIGRMTIGHYLFRCRTDDVNSLLKKALRYLHISLFAQHRVNQTAVEINGSIQRAPFSMDSHKGLINVPGTPSLTSLSFP
jgi:hypothetical protein